jgi:SM-20-related protein
VLDLLRRLGVFAEPGFLDVATCQAACAEMVAAEGEPGVLLVGTHTSVDVRKKRLIDTHPSAASSALVEHRLAAMTSALNRHFGVTLTGSEGVHFYRYGVGDFFATHRDVYQDDQPFGHQRRVSIVLFLNDPAGRAGVRYEGGSLVLYDLMGEGRGAGYGISVPPEAGLLVAFRSELRHEVTPVTAGTRCVAVNRLY